MTAPGFQSRFQVAAISLALAALVFLSFGETLRQGFINYDDPEAVSGNPMVMAGPSWSGLVWALRNPQVGDWVPLTTVSHMVDCGIFHLWAGGHHLTNLLLHAAGAILLFLIVREMTGALWRSAFVAAVFAVHPLRVESVAWITERKDLLCGVLSLLTIAAYVRHARRPSPGKLVTVAALFASALMAKSMAVTIPFVLLLFDYWPLRRLSISPPATIWPLLREKLPLLFLSGAAATIQLFTARAMIQSLHAMPFANRLGNALMAYATYLGQAFYPTRLSIFYPFSASGIAWPLAVGAFILLVSLSTLAFVCRKQRPYLLVGWLWFLGALVPVIGLVQSGTLARADRYTYFPQIGLYLAVTWLAADFMKRSPSSRWVAWPLAVAALACLVIASRRQVSYWRDSETLWRHALACTNDNFDAEEGFGEAVLEHGRLAEAASAFEKALHFQPDSDRAHDQLGFVLMKEGRFDDAIAQFRAALAINPSTPEVHRRLGLVLIDRGDLSDGIDQLQLTVRDLPRDAVAHARLASALMREGRIDEAREHYGLAIQIVPRSAAYRLGLAEALLARRETGAAVAELRKTLEIDPRSVVAMARLAWICSTSTDAALRDGAQAVELAQKAVDSSGSPTNPALLRILAAADAESGRFDNAVAAAGQALALATGPRDGSLAERLKSELVVYQSHRPLRVEALTEAGP